MPHRAENICVVRGGCWTGVIPRRYPSLPWWWQSSHGKGDVLGFRTTLPCCLPFRGEVDEWPVIVPDVDIKGGCWANDHPMDVSGWSPLGLSHDYSEPYGGFRGWRGFKVVLP